MSSSKVALAEHVIYEHFGAAVGVVGGILLARGRLSYETLLRLLPRSTFTQATAQAALLVLIQHNCLYYVHDEEEGTEYFEMDLDEVLHRRRFGQFMALTREHYGKRAMEVLMQVLAEGKIKLATLLEDCQELPEERNTIRAIYELLDAGVLRPVKMTDQTSKADQDLQWEKQLLREVKGPPGPKDIKRIHEEVEQKRAEMDGALRSWGKDHETYVSTCLSDDTDNAPENSFMETEPAYGSSRVRSQLELACFISLLAEGSYVIKKRRANTNAGASSSKSQRLALPFDEKTWVRARYEPFDVRIRNEIIVKAVRGQRGGAAAVLVQSILNESAKDEKNLFSQFSNYTDAARLVKPANRKSPTRQTIPLPDVNGYGAEAPPDHAFFSVFPHEDGEVTMGMEHTGMWSAENKAPLDLVNEVLHHLHGTGDARPKFGSLEGAEEIGSARLDGTVCRPNSWLVSDYNDTKVKSVMARQNWAVDYLSAGEIVKVGLLETYIQQQFGKQAKRIWTALAEKGKMEEKQIAKAVMLPAKDVRESVAALSSAGFLLQQEVPRTVDRNPSRAFFLWYVSRPKCCQLMLHHLYETLVNLYVRRESEKEKNKAILRRSERSDVRENIQLLDKADRQELEAYEWRMESLGIAQERVDRDIFVLDTMPAFEF